MANFIHRSHYNNKARNSITHTFPVNPLEKEVKSGIKKINAIHKLHITDTGEGKINGNGRFLFKSYKESLNPYKAISNALKVLEDKDKIGEWNSGSILRENFGLASEKIGRLCNIDLSLLPQYIESQLGSKVESIETLKFILIAKDYLKKELAVINDCQLWYFREYFNVNNEELKRLFVTISNDKEGTMRSLEEIKEFIKTAFKNFSEKFSQAKDICKESDTVLNHIINEHKEVTINFNELIIKIGKYIESKNMIKNGSKSEERSVSNIRISIKKQVELLKQKKLLGKDTTITKNLIYHLKNHLSGRLPKKHKTLDESNDIEMNLKEIFYFYCRQQCTLSKKHTFDEMSRNASYMTMGEFIIFCKDFNIPLKSSKVKELFKRQVRESKQVDFNVFLVSINISYRRYWVIWQMR